MRNINDPNLRQERTLGSGRFGEVVQFYNLSTENMVAIKFFHNKTHKSGNFYSTAESEAHNFNFFVEKMNLHVDQAKIIHTSDGNAIMFPFFSGNEPTYKEIQDYLEKIYDSGFVIGDPKPDNFMHTHLGLLPVDYGAVFYFLEQPKYFNKTAINYIVNAPIDYKEAFRDGWNGDIARKYMAIGDQIIRHSQPSTTSSSPSKKSSASSSIPLLGSIHGTSLSPRLWNSMCDSKSEVDFTYVKADEQDEKKDSRCQTKCCVIL